MPAGRYAPSPTGRLHVGNLRTAMLAWLAARASGRPFLLRIEDLDRVRAGSEDAQLAELTALGLDWDAPAVRQSERTGLYDAAVAALRTAHGPDAVYECFCSRKDIAHASSAPNGPGRLPGQAPTPLRPPGFYPGTCRTLTEAQREQRRAVRPAALRLNAALVAGLPEGGHPEARAHDLLTGEVTGLVDDMVLRRNDGAYAYNLAVVADDLAQGVDQVVRGDDLLDSTPRQTWLAAVLCAARDEPAPRTEHLHVPLVVNGQGRRLAKRDGAVTLEDLSGVEDVREADPARLEAIRDALLRSAGLPAGPLPAAVPAFAAALEAGALPREPWVFDAAAFA